MSHKIASVNPKLLVTEVFTMLGIIVLCLVLQKLFTSGNKTGVRAFVAGGLLGAASLIRMNPLILFPIVIFVMGVVFLRKKKELLKIILSFTFGFGVLILPWVITGTDVNGVPYFFIKFIDVVNARYSLEDCEDTDRSLLYEPINNKDFRILSEDYFLNLVDGDNGVDLDQFPGFVFNHFFHNVVNSFLALPTTFSSKEQILDNLALREYFDDNATQEWSGELDWWQIPTIIVNLALFSGGIAVCWKTWQFRGVVPLIIYLGYLLSLGLARTSGSRYLVPVDWIIYFYFLIGLVSLVAILNQDLKKLLITNFSEIDFVEDRGERERASSPLAIIFVIIMGLIVPVADTGLQIGSNLCNNVPAEYYLQVDNQNIENGSLLFGQVLYPQKIEDDTKFILLTCRDYNEIVLSLPEFVIESGDLVISVDQGDNIRVLGTVNE